eukprot:4003643-Pleurochrysis_carterae.AAC.1
MWCAYPSAAGRRCGRHCRGNRARTEQCGAAGVALSGGRGEGTRDNARLPPPTSPPKPPAGRARCAA